MFSVILCLPPSQTPGAAPDDIVTLGVEATFSSIDVTLVFNDVGGVASGCCTISRGAWAEWVESFGVHVAEGHFGH